MEASTIRLVVTDSANDGYTIVDDGGDPTHWEDWIIACEEDDDLNDRLGIQESSFLDRAAIGEEHTNGVRVMPLTGHYWDNRYTFWMRKEEVT